MSKPITKTNAKKYHKLKQTAETNERDEFYKITAVKLMTEYAIVKAREYMDLHGKYILTYRTMGDFIDWLLAKQAVDGAKLITLNPDRSIARF